MIFQQPSSSPATSGSAPPASATSPALPPAPAGSSLATNPRGRLRSRGVMILIAVVGLGIIGAKLFWPEPPKLEAAAAATPVESTKASTGTPKKPAATASKPKTTATSEKGAKPAPAVAGKTSSKAPTKTARGKAAEPLAETPVAEAPAAPDAKPTQAAAASAEKPVEKPAAAPVVSAVRRRTTSPAPARPADPLGAIYIDETNGYSIRFPAGWSIRSFKGEPWVIDAGDGRVGLISIGFSPFPNGFTTESIPPEWIARRIKRRTDTTLHGQGYATIGGRKALWSKSTGPLPMTHANPRMTRVNYILPTGDGRVLELRVAASPEVFDRVGPLMKKAVETFKLVPLQGVEPVASAGR